MQISDSAQALANSEALMALDPGEDLNRNGILDPSEDTNGTVSLMKVKIGTAMGY